MNEYETSHYQEVMSYSCCERPGILQTSENISFSQETEAALEIGCSEVSDLFAVVRNGMVRVVETS